MRTRNIEGRHLRWFAAGLLCEHFKAMGKDAHGADFAYLLDDTCNKLTGYLQGNFSTSGSWTDLQCRTALEAQAAFDVKLGDSVTIGW